MLLEIPRYYDPPVSYSAHTGEWNVQRTRHANDVSTGVVWGTARMNAFRIIEETLNLRDARVYDTSTDASGNKRTEINKAETTKAQQKQEAIKQC
jgi:N12 class adenine-specific DNA methylase